MPCSGLLETTSFSNEARTASRKFSNGQEISPGAVELGLLGSPRVAGQRLQQPARHRADHDGVDRVVAMVGAVLAVIVAERAVTPTCRATGL